jgi:Predicted oxidoreductases (related to aryl-alcohol dehydrogenases)
VQQLVLGTAQWGDSYGVTNAVGRLVDSEIASIVAVARETGITEVDTARGYGDAETRLRPFAREFAVTTKVSGGGDVLAQVDASLAELGLDSVDGVLIHDWDALDCKGQGLSVLSYGELLDSGRVSRVGVSVYDSAGLESAVSTFDAGGVPLGVVQVPANVSDRRLDESSSLMDLAAAGTQVVVRSAFLQGVLLSAGGGLADHPDVVRFRESVGPETSLLEACLAHVRALPWASHVVVGVTSAAELREIAAAWKACAPAIADSSLASSDLELIDPRRW